MIFKIVPELLYEKTLSGNICKRSAYLERCVNSDHLLITVGDSWTWGDCLGKINIDRLIDPICDDLDYRRNHVYGNYIQQHLNCDWINFGWCGYSNVHIFELLKDQILQYVTTRYKKITVIVVLTETARQCNKDHLKIDNHNSVVDYLKNYEKLEFEFIKNTLTEFNVENFLISRNFTYSFNENKNIFNKHHVNKTWVDIIGEYIDNTSYPSDLRFLSDIVVTPLINVFKHYNKLVDVKPEFTQLFDQSLTANKWLTNSDLNYKKATKHPTELAHQIWAQYLITQLNI